MDELAAFLTARLNEMEATAEAAAERAPAPWVGAFKQVTSEPPGGGIRIVASTQWSAVSHHIERQEPDTVLADIAGKRMVLGLYARTLELTREPPLTVPPPGLNAMQRGGLEPGQPGISARDYMDARRELAVLRAVVKALAWAWRTDPDWREDWEPDLP